MYSDVSETLDLDTILEAGSGTGNYKIKPARRYATGL